jgi:hypothetical protein
MIMAEPYSNIVAEVAVDASDCIKGEWWMAFKWKFES